MNKTRITIVSGVQNHDAYRSLFAHKENVELRPFSCDTLNLDSEGTAVLVLDSGFDIKKGLDFAKHYKSHFSDIPIVFITEISSEDMVIEAFRLGIREYLKKPFDVMKLHQIIDLLLEISQMKNEKRMAFPLYCRHRNESPDSLEVIDLPTNIYDVLGYIKANLNEDLCLEKLAAHASISKFHFCKTFKKHMGLPPLRYVNVMRIDKAKRLLCKNGLNISDVAIQVGFNDLSSFCKHFKRLTGMSPTTFKTAVRESAVSNPIHINNV